MELHMSTAMYISEIPVRYPSMISQGEKTTRWINDLTARTTARDVINSILPSHADTNKYSLYIYLGRSKQILPDSARIYKVVASIHQQKYARRLLFEIRSKKAAKRVRFADEIVVQTIVRRQCVTDEQLTTDLIETISKPIADSKENYSCEKKLRKSSKHSKRSSLKLMVNNISPSSSESGISSNLSNDDATALETLV